MGRWLSISLSCVFAALVVPSAAFADGRPLDSLRSVHQACGLVRQSVNARLYVIELQEGWRFAEQDGEELVIDTGRNLLALDGHVSLLVPHMERLAFEVDAEAGAVLREAAQGGARLKIGFFLGFDDRTRQPCLVRNRHAVTIVRVDVAYLELVAENDVRVARTETDRLRAWNDDREAMSVEGEGPRGAVGAASFSNGDAAPERWQAVLGGVAARRAIAQCHAAGVQRGATEEGQVVVRLNIETRTGAIRRSDVALSSIGDSTEAECIAQALGSRSTLSPGPSSWQAEFVDLSVPVRLVTD